MGLLYRGKRQKKKTRPCLSARTMPGKKRLRGAFKTCTVPAPRCDILVRFQVFCTNKKTGMQCLLGGIPNGEVLLIVERRKRCCCVHTKLAIQSPCTT